MLRLWHIWHIYGLFSMYSSYLGVRLISYEGKRHIQQPRKCYILWHHITHSALCSIILRRIINVSKIRQDAASGNRRYWSIQHCSISPVFQTHMPLIQVGVTITLVIISTNTVLQHFRLPLSTYNISIILTLDYTSNISSTCYISTAMYNIPYIFCYFNYFLEFSINFIY